MDVQLWGKLVDAGAESEPSWEYLLVERALAVVVLNKFDIDMENRKFVGFDKTYKRIFKILAKAYDISVDQLI